MFISPLLLVLVRVTACSESGVYRDLQLEQYVPRCQSYLD